MTKFSCDVHSCFLCRHCLNDWLPAVAANKQNIEVKKGQLLFKEGDPVKGIYFIYSGIFKIHKKWGRDKELIVRFAGKGDVAGQMGLGADAVYPISATAVETGMVCYVEMAFFETTLNVNSGFTRRLLSALAQNLQESEKRMRNLAHMPVKGRVAQALINLKDQFGTNAEGVINVELSRQDLAAFTGAAYESLFRTINELVDEKVITLAGKGISINNEAMLLRLTEETNL